MRVTQNDQHHRVVDAINANESRVVVATELPVAEEYWRGYMVLLEQAAANDQLWMCIREAAGTFAWVRIY